MLGKLYRHEMKATSRLLLPIYLVLAVLTIMDRIVIYLDIFKGALVLIPGFITFAYVLSIIAVFTVSFVIIILRFYKNLLTDEGYLMFTLPVKTHELINSKLLVSIIWNIASIIGVIVSLLIVFSGSSAFKDLPDMWDLVITSLQKEFGSNLTLFTIEMIVLTIVSIINGILMIYVSIAIGQLINGHKVLGSFAAYIGISTVIQIISTIGTFFLGMIFKNSFNEMTSITQILFPLLILYFIILTVIYYWATCFIFKKKVNLD